MLIIGTGASLGDIGLQASTHTTSTADQTKNTAVEALLDATAEPSMVVVRKRPPSILDLIVKHHRDVCARRHGEGS